jgi:two-component system heavy metal sensor histidine kinase CusS
VADSRQHFPRPSISTQIVVGVLAAVVVVIGLSSFFLNRSLAALFPREGNSELQETGDRLVGLLNGLDCEPEPPEPPDPDGPRLPDPFKKAPLGRFVLEGTEHLFVRVMDHQGLPLLESEGLSRLLPLQPIPELEDRLWRYAEGPTGGRFITYTREFEQGWVTTAWDIRHENRLLKKSQDLLWLTWGLATLVTGACVVLIARHGLKPLKALEAQAEAIRPGALMLDVDPSTLPRDLGSLAQKLKEALTRLEEAFSRLTTLNADMAHELRTPIHGARIQIEGLLREGDCTSAQSEALEGVIETLDQLSAMLDQMLFLARSEDPAMALQLEPLDVAKLLRATIAPFGPLAEERRVQLEVRLSEHLALKADEKLVRRALHNLLANALNHAPEGSMVLLEGLVEPDAVTLQVRDEGDGIPQAFLDKIGQRFSRPDFARSRHAGGAGLGLAIVKNILRLHGGTLAFDSTPGHGTTAKLRFPLA